MDEYINKTEILFEMATSLIPQSMDITRAYAIAKDIIKKAPAADVVPVRHGEWIYDHWCEFKCSECGQLSDSKPYKGKERYCPNCGTRMDK